MDSILKIGDRVETNKLWFKKSGNVLTGKIIEVIPCNSSYYPDIFYKIDMGEHGIDYFSQRFLNHVELVNVKDYIRSVKNERISSK